MQREIVALRQAELSYALKRVRELPWVDQDHLFGWGHSEGVVAMGNFPGAIFKARILTGYDCHRGFAAEEPTLVVMASEDPYHGHKSRNCWTASNGAENVTYLEVPGSEHNAAQTDEGRRAVIGFIRNHLSSAK